MVDEIILGLLHELVIDLCGPLSVLAVPDAAPIVLPSSHTIGAFNCRISSTLERARADGKGSFYLIHVDKIRCIVENDWADVLSNEK